MWYILIIVLCLINCFQTRSFPGENTTVLISKYAKVAHWGVVGNETKSDSLEKRSGQALWTHRSDVNLVSRQSVKNDIPMINYPYAVYKKQHSKVDDEKFEKIPAIGEVIQDRYNPRPYFGYTKIPPKSEESAMYNAPTAPATSGFDINSFNVPSTTSKSVDLYSSPYTSYNPPPLMSDYSFATDIYPPSQDSYAAPPKDGYDYNAKGPQGSESPSYSSLGPPLSPEYISNTENDSMFPNDHKHHDDDQDHNHHDHNHHDHDHDHDVDAPPSDQMSIGDFNGSPYYPMKSEDTIYYNSDVSGGAHHPPKDDMATPNMNMNMNMDLMSPDHGRFPQYLYDSQHFDHHIYEEVPHTTTEATEDKRVSSGHYSYYYLGRKLWYVPLYFSIYFIIYVTVLILKAIARHKIQYKHKWVSSVRGGRKLNSNENNYIEDVTRNVTTAVEKAKKMYAYAM